MKFFRFVTDGKLRSRLWALSWPVMVTNLLHITVQVVDTMMVGRLGPESIAAIGLGNSIRLFLFILVLSVAAGAISLMAQAKGSRDPARANQVTRQSIIAGFLLSLGLLIIGCAIAWPVLGLLDRNASPAILEMAHDYLLVIFIGSPFLILNLVCDRLMQGAGETRIPMVLTALMVLLNILLNYLLIFGPGIFPALGLLGAALGTVGARAILTIVYLAMFYSKKYAVSLDAGPWIPDWRLIKDIMSIGLPSGIQGIFRRGANVFLIGLITATSLGTLGAAAMTIGWQIESLIAQLIVGVNVAGTALVGHELGRWQVKEAYNKGNDLILLGFLIGMVLVVPILFFPQYIIMAFDPSLHPLIAEGTTSFIYTCIFFLPVSGLSIVITGNMRGAGDTVPPMVSTLVFRNLVTIILAWYLAFICQLDYWGIWYAMVIGRLLDAITMVVIWIRRRWPAVALRQSEIYRRHLTHLSPKLLDKYLTEVRAPMMAREGVTEQIGANDVIYTSKTTQQRYVFETGSYIPQNQE